MTEAEKQETVANSSEPQEAKELIEEAEKVRDILIKAESVFPFVLFPDTVAVTRAKVVITIRTFFRVSEVISLQIEDILNVESDLGPFFGSIKVYTRVYGTQPLRITFLKRKDTIAVKRIIEGHIIAHRQGIENTHLEKDELIKLLKSLGNDSPLT